MANDSFLNYIRNVAVATSGYIIIIYFDVYFIQVFVFIFLLALVNLNNHGFSLIINLIHY